jgi:hypothetical protein
MNQKQKLKIVSSIVLLAFAFCLIPFVSATQTIHINGITNHPIKYYGFRNGAYISFGQNCICQNPVIQQGNNVTFNMLTLNGVVSTFTISSTKNLTVTASDFTNYFVYTVNGSGTQTFTSPTQPTQVIIDGTVQPAGGTAWTYTNGLVTVTSASVSASFYYGTILGANYGVPAPNGVYVTTAPINPAYPQASPNQNLPTVGNITRNGYADAALLIIGLAVIAVLAVAAKSQENKNKRKYS